MWEVWEVFAQKLYLGVKNMCKKFREHPTVGLDLCRGNILTNPADRIGGMVLPHLFNCYMAISPLYDMLDHLNQIFSASL